MIRRKCVVEVSRDTLKEKVAKGWVESRMKRNKKYRTRRHSREDK